MLILAIIVFGLLVGGLAQLVLGRSMRDVNWTVAIVTGLLGSLVGGLLASLLAGDGLELRASGLIGSFVGALILTLAWSWYAGRRGSA
ncbi:GlsB/YeaQ/YmgE family stress response membrane protein [Nocardioides sediminis]|uniref:GlsB/YeaQ/YmgE family stress response membrane protein n=1 Tax=Nocardioides sediminis TaxID=433648 RepID=UPI000D318B6F|nr:GlsB/YeaQ/YmgE family stress response membrane protein [Nocardioides sediminis]